MTVSSGSQSNKRNFPKSMRSLTAWKDRHFKKHLNEKSFIRTHRIHGPLLCADSPHRLCSKIWLWY